MKLRSLAIGLTLVTAGTAIGAATQQFASAEISSGNRPVLVPVGPCRLVDTRPGGATVGPRSSPLGAADTLTVDVQEPDTDCAGLIPADALSLSLNVTAVGATEQTFLTIWPDGPRPDASSLNPAPGAPPTPNAVTVDLSGDQEFEIYNDLGSVNLIVDIDGYYETHNHDDRYYTQAQVDDAVNELRVRTHVLSTTSFRTTNPGVELTAGNIFGAYVSGTDGSTQSVRAPFEIPVGARVTEVTYHYVDDDPARNLRLGVSRSSLSQNNQSNLSEFSFDTSGASSDVRSETITPDFVVPGDADLNWSVFNNDWAAAGNDLAIKGIVFTYVLP